MGPIFKGFGFDLKILNQNGYQLTQNGFVHIYTNIYIDMYGHLVYHKFQRARFMRPRWDRPTLRPVRIQLEHPLLF